MELALQALVGLGLGAAQTADAAVARGAPFGPGLPRCRSEMPSCQTP